MNTTIDQPLIESTIAALEQMAARLAVDGLLAGPAGVQQSIDDLIVAERIVGSFAELSDASVVTLLLSEASAGVLAAGGSPDALIAMAEPHFDQVAAGLGLSVVSIAPILSVDAIPAAMTAIPGARILVGAGIFEGETPVASVGVCRVIGADAAVSGAPVSSSAASSVSMPGMTAGVARNLHLLADVTLGVTAELGGTTMTMGGLLDLQPGGVIELDREAGSPIDLLVNGTLIARGEVVVSDGHYGVRVTEVVAEDETR